MAQPCFYAIGDDVRKLLNFIFESTDLVVYEAYSRFDEDLRTFSTIEELDAAYPLAATPSLLLRFWSPSVSEAPTVVRFHLDAKRVPGHRFRHSVEGVGLIQLTTPSQKRDRIRHAGLSCWNEAGARARCGPDADLINWAALRRVFGRLQRHVFGHLAVAKLFSYRILGDALACVDAGTPLFFGGKLYFAGSEEIVRESPNNALEQSAAMRLR